MEITYDKILKEHILETDTFNMLLGSEKLSDEAVADIYSKIDSIVENYNRNKKKIFQMVYYRARDFDRSIRLRNIEDLLGKPQYDPMCSCVVYYGHIADHMVTVYLKDGEFDKPYSVCLDGWDALANLISDTNSNIHRKDLQILFLEVFYYGTHK